MTVEGPESKEGYEDLKLWVNPKQPNVGMMTDEGGQVAGVQLNVSTIHFIHIFPTRVGRNSLHTPLASSTFIHLELMSLLFI